MKPRIPSARLLRSLQSHLPSRSCHHYRRYHGPSSLPATASKHSTRFPPRRTTTTTTLPSLLPSSSRRTFTTTPHPLNWLQPKGNLPRPRQKGRPRVRTGGSTKGTTVIWGDYGLRLLNHDLRLSARSLSIGADAIKKRLRGEKFRFYTRVAASHPVFTKGNETRMGKGKGKFDYWAARVAVSQVVFEIKGASHEQVYRDAMRLAGAKMPGQWEFVKRGDPPVMGTTKMGEGVTVQGLRKPVRVKAESTKAERIGATSSMPLPSTLQQGGSGGEVGASAGL